MLPCMPSNQNALRSHRQVLIELRAVASYAFADAVEHFERRAFGVSLCLQHQGRHDADQHHFRDPLRAVAADIAHNFPAAHRMPDDNDVPEVQSDDQLSEIIGKLVHIVAVPRLVGSAMTTAIMGNNPVSMLTKKQHLIVPGV
jgi:hypothetical protein